MIPDLLDAVVLGVVQGATEFLPVSSSAHLVLVPAALGWPPPGLAFDTALHWGTAAATLAYYWREWVAIASGSLRALLGRRPSEKAGLEGAENPVRLLALLVVATLPAAVMGVAFHDRFERMFVDPRMTAATLPLTGALLAVAELRRRGTRSTADLGILGAALIGFAQAAAIVPAISRSGATIACALALGMRRDEATRFSFLMSAPIIVGAAALELGVLAASRPSPAEALSLAAGIVAAGAVGYASIAWFVGYVSKHTLWPFVAYTVLAGVAAYAWLS